MNPILIGHLPFPSGELCAALLQCVLERLGHRVALVEGTSDELLGRLGAGGLHLVSSAALQLAGPDCNGVRQGTTEVAALSRGDRFLWSIPEIGALREVRSIADLAGAPLRREIAAVRDGPAALRSREALRAYGLETFGFRMREDTMAHWRTLCRQAGGEGRAS